MNTTAGYRLQFIGAALIFGTIGYTVRFVHLPSEVVVLCRAVLGTLFIFLLQMIRRQRPDWRAIRAHGRWLLLSGFGLGLNWICLFAAYVHTSVALASLINYTAPIIFIALTPFLYHERLGWKRLLCVAGAVAGIILVSGVTEEGAGADVLGMAMAAVAAVGFVIVLICNRRLTAVPGLDRASVQLGVSALVVLPYVLALNWGRPLTTDATSLLLVLVLGVFQTGVAYVLYFGSMGSLPVHTVALLGYLEPVMSVLFSALLLGEPLTPAGMVGAALIICSAAASELVKE